MALKRSAIKIFVISDSCFRVFYHVCFGFGVSHNVELWEMIGERCGYVNGGAFIVVAADKYDVNKCCCSACYSSRMCHCHCVKSVRIRSYSGPYFPTFELNTKRYGSNSPYSVRMQENTDQNNSEYGHFLRTMWHELMRVLF